MAAEVTSGGELCGGVGSGEELVAIVGDDDELGNNVGTVEMIVVAADDGEEVIGRGIVCGGLACRVVARGEGKGCKGFAGGAVIVREGEDKIFLILAFVSVKTVLISASKPETFLNG
jgi:hypothetical protein